MNLFVPPSAPRPNLWGNISVLHLAVVLMSLVMTFGAWQSSKSQIVNKVDGRFDSVRDSTVRLIRDGMARYEDALWAGVSAIESHNGDMSLQEWRAFSSTLRIDEKYPGINGIGVIHFVDEDGFANYMQQRRAERPAFEVFPKHASSVRMPISFIEPEAINAAAVGLDVAHELNRRTAALASRDTGTAQITGPITLVQDAGSTPGFLFYAPFQSGTPTGSATERAIGGAVYAPFVVRKLMEGLLAKELRDVRFSIRDGAQVIYDEHAVEDPLADPDPMVSQEVYLDLYGRTWVVDLRSNLAFRSSNTYAQPTIILLGGLLIEILIITMLVTLARANQNAVTYADRVTANLLAEKQKLDFTNQELEQFVYIASHDLKTPVRGISGLTEMLREDLEEYLISPDAVPEVAENLDRIDARVERMNVLTRSIMEFSRVGDYELVHEPLFLNEAVDALVSDFGLNADQVVLNSDVETVFVDTFNLRRVLENLVGNAIKYHDGINPLRIDLSVEQRAEKLMFIVADNGPGIDPKFHNRVFEVFQTLRAADAPESTGIGLAIVKKIVERHHGKITLTSAPGTGASFAFDWPGTAAVQHSHPLEKAA